jgi:hypothetical protein
MNPPFQIHRSPPIPRGAIPDAETGDCIYLVKNVPFLRATQQIRLLAAKASLSNKHLILMTPAACRIDEPLEELMRNQPEIVRRGELR